MNPDLLKQRFAKKISITMHCRIVTPMFLGDAEQKAALWPEPFKGLLRYWWRVAAGRTFSDPKTMLEEETKVFGGGGEKAQKSLVTVEVDGTPEIIETSEVPRLSGVWHPEVGRQIHPLLYLSYGPVTWRRGQGPIYTRSYLKPGDTFRVIWHLPSFLLEKETFKSSFLYFCAFGAIGSRSRNGWGSFQVEKIEPEITSKILYALFTPELFEKDFPFTLAAEKKTGKTIGLLWKSKNIFNSWPEAMKELAQIYINVRTPLSSDGPNDIDERHLLGFPLTHHLAYDAPNWGRNARHASPLRLFVRKKKNGYQGFILHLPFGISKRMRKNAAGIEFFTPNKQFEIWQKVHKRLDKAMERASINDCL